MKKKKPTITAHCLIKNEENFIRYAINSVLPYVDKMIVFDTGSTDKTIDVVKEILNSPEGKKINYEGKGTVDGQTHTVLRNEMIKITETDWFMVLDGDEVWPDDQIRFLINEDLPSAEKVNRNCIMVSYHLCNVDLHHYTESGHFGSPWGLHGHFAYRLFKRANGIHWEGYYGKDTLKYNNEKKVVKQRNTYFSSAYFWHLSKLDRSTKSHLRVGGIKSSKIKWLPRFLQKRLVIEYKHEIPEIFNRY